MQGKNYYKFANIPTSNAQKVSVSILCNLHSIIMDHLRIFEDVR